MNIIHTFSKRIFFLFCLVFLITSCNLGKTSLSSVSPTQKANPYSCVGIPKPDFPSSNDKPTISALLAGGVYRPTNILGDGIGSSVNPLRVFINESFFVALTSIKGTPFYQQNPSQLMSVFEGDLSRSAGLTNVKLDFVSSANEANVVVGTYDLSTILQPHIMVTLPIDIMTVLMPEDWFASICEKLGINYNDGYNRQAAIALDCQNNVQGLKQEIQQVIEQVKTYQPDFVPTIENMLPYVEHVFMHEIAHVLGLNHSNETQNIYTMAQLGIAIVPHNYLLAPSVQAIPYYVTYYAKVVKQMNTLPHSYLVRKAASLNANDINSVKYIDQWNN